MPTMSLIRDFLKKNPNGITLEQIYQYCADCGATFQSANPQDQKRSIAAQLSKMKSRGEVTVSGGFWKINGSLEKSRLKLSLLEENLAICKLDPASPPPEWTTSQSFYSITRTPEELSVVCPESGIPKEIQREKGFRCYKIEGQLNFSQVGVIASIAQLLAGAGVSIFTISTYNTDYILVKQHSLDKAEKALQAAGYLG